MYKCDLIDAVKSIKTKNKLIFIVRKLLRIWRCKKMVEIKNVSYKYKNDEMVLEDINLEIKANETVCIIREKWFWEIKLSKTYCRNYSPKQGRYFYFRDKYKR